MRLDLFSASYFGAAHVHLGTAPPQQQLTWLKFLRESGRGPVISVDTFERFVITEPEASRETCDLADLIFINEHESRILYGEGTHPKAPAIVKRGAAGADYIADGEVRHVPAPAVRRKDTTGAGEILAGVFLALHTRGLAEIPALTPMLCVSRPPR